MENGKWKMENLKLVKGIGIFTFYFLLFTSQVFAQCDPATELCHPFPNTQTTLVVGQALQKIIGMLGVVAFIVIVIAAVRWMTASGNPETVQKARDTVVWAALGLVVTATSYAILEFIFSALRGAFYGA